MIVARANTLVCDRLAPAAEYKGTGGPEDKVKIESERHGGDQEALSYQDMKHEGIAK